LGIAVDASGNAYITGWTSSVDFPTQNPPQPDCGGSYDAFMAKIGEANGQVVNFPDLNLEQAIRDALGKPTEDIYNTDLIELTFLRANERSIVDLEGIQYCVDLMGLALDGNQISNIAALARLTNLTNLDLDGNQISDITPLVGLTNLIKLSLGDNEISEITPLAGLTNLIKLNLWQNQISNIAALAGLTNLMKLALNHNQISDIAPLAGLSNLMWLHLGDNQISEIAPLVSNTGIDSGDYVQVHWNLLTLIPNSEDMQNIQALINRGVDVDYEPQNAPGSQPPIADAGPDQTVTDSDGNGQENIVLDGSGSEAPNGNIISWIWTEKGNQIATGETSTGTLSVGTHTIILTVIADVPPSQSEKGVSGQCFPMFSGIL